MTKSENKERKKIIKLEKRKKKKNSKKNNDVLEEISITGVLTSRQDSPDVQIDSFSIILYGKYLIKDTALIINSNRKYGIIGQNGCGKSTLLRAIAAKVLPIPESIDIYHLSKECEPLKINALEMVTRKVKEKVKKLEEELEKILIDDPESENIELLMEKLDMISIDTIDQKASEILLGLGFTQNMLERYTEDMSGGWRMRVALAQSLLMVPTLLLLDEPTNHLDLEACIWLENYLANYPKTLMIISHSQDFLNGVCTNIIEINQEQELEYYGGNYDIYCRTREENRINQMKKYKKEQDDLDKLKKFIRSCGTYSNLVKQAQSKQKIIDKMIEAGLTKKPKSDPKYSFKFPECNFLPTPILSFKNVSFGYDGHKENYLYKNLDFGVDLDSRIALVGPNGVGKSTLLKLMINELQPSEGDISRHSHLRIAYYNQHSEDILDLDQNPIEFLSDYFSEGIVLKNTNGKKIKPEFNQWRRILGSYGITGNRQTDPMKNLSDGLKTRVIFAILGLKNPHILLLDEPTNHLDMDCINSLAEAILEFEGGMILVSHDFRLLSQVAEEIWVCDNKKITKWEDEEGIRSYKKYLQNKSLKNLNH